MPRTVVIFLNLLVYIFADTIKDREYININNPIPCIRRFNATHQIGCAKLDIDNYEGVVFAVREQAEFERLKLVEVLDRKLIVVTIPEFYPEVVKYYLDNRVSSEINGIVLASIENDKNQTKPDSYSDDTKRPNENYDLYNRDKRVQVVDWNLAETYGYMFENFEIPIYIVTEESEINKIFNDCFEKFNQKVFYKDNIKNAISSTELLCGMQLGMEMSGAVNSKVCIRRGSIQYTVDANMFCDPLGGANYFTFLSQKPSNDLPITIVSSRIDTYSMYEYYTPAANEPITSIIGLLSIAELLSKNREDMTKENVLFVLFDNEAFDYGGSSRFVNDLANDKFPSFSITDSNSTEGKKSFKLDKGNIQKVIELNQLGSIGLNDQNKLYIHKDPLSYSSSQIIADLIDNFTTNLKSISNNSIVPVDNENQELAPSSIHSFLRQKIPVAGLLITDHDKSYTNKYFHSVFDTPENLKISFPANISESEAVEYTTLLGSKLQTMLTAIASTIYSQGSGKSDLKDQVNQKTINQLIYCFYKNTTCDYFKNILTEKQWSIYKQLLNSNLPKNKLSFYTSVNDAQISGKWISQILLKYFTRNNLFENLNKTECVKDSASFKKIVKENNLSPTNINFNNNQCIGTSLYSVSSVSPAFDKYLDGDLVDTDKFPSWTESSWNGKTVQMRLFMFTCEATEISTFVIGLSTFFISIALTFVAERFSSKLFAFENNMTPEHATEIIQ